MLLVPAMSETLMTFGGPVAHLVGAQQAFVAVANNPGAWHDQRYSDLQYPARALFGHPGLGQQIRLVTPPDPGPGVALMNVGSAAITWIPASADLIQPGSRRAPATSPIDPSSAPTWLPAYVAFPEHPDQPLNPWPDVVNLTRAAVLVLLTDSPNGPCVLLTERAADLTDYPGRLVFPGGAVDTSDEGPVSTALREAAEEIGLDPGSVQVLGALAPQMLPESGFLVVPVLAWSNYPKIIHSVNYAEVAATYEVPLRALAARTMALGSSRVAEPSRSGSGPDLTALGRMTATVVDHLVRALDASRSTADAARP